jgi:tRNA(His) guanylyltransferase
MPKDKSKDSFGDRMKEYEGVETERKLIRGLPIMVRLDGKSFHTYTKKFKRPFDPILHEAFRQTGKYLVEKTDARLFYTQSDELTLFFQAEGHDTELFFNRKTMKLTSVLASMCTAYFNDYIHQNSSVKDLAIFDCRVWNVPNTIEAANTILWREKDAIKNSISSLALQHFSAKELLGKSTKERKEMLEAKGISWDSLDSKQKRGSYGIIKYEEFKSGDKIKRRRKLILCDDMINFSDMSNRHEVVLGEDPIQREVL